MRPSRASTAAFGHRAAAMGSHGRRANAGKRNGASNSTRASTLGNLRRAFDSVGALHRERSDPFACPQSAAEGSSAVDDFVQPTENADDRRRKRGFGPCPVGIERRETRPHPNMRLGMAANGKERGCSRQGLARLFSRLLRPPPTGGRSAVRRILSGGRARQTEITGWRALKADERGLRAVVSK
jgi:hypothetical protein